MKTVTGNMKSMEENVRRVDEKMLEMDANLKGIRDDMQKMFLLIA